MKLMSERLQTWFCIFFGSISLAACFPLAGKIWRAKFKEVPTFYTMSKPLTNSFRVVGGIVLPITEKHYDLDPSMYIKTHSMESDIQSIRWKVEFVLLTGPSGSM